MWSPIYSVIELHETNRGLATKLKNLKEALESKRLKEGGQKLNGRHVILVKAEVEGEKWRSNLLEIPETEQFLYQGIERL